MQQVALGDVVNRVNELLRADKPVDARNLLVPALGQYPDNPALWFYAGYAAHRLGEGAVAAAAWARSWDLEPQAQVLANLGAAMREARPETARMVLRKALRLNPGDRQSLTNLIGAYVNEGCPDEGLAIAAEHPAVAAEESQFQFNLALINLEAGNFATGFELYARGHHEARDRRTYEGAERLTWHNFEAARGSRLIVYGEQGIGDELMFATMLGDIAVPCSKVIFDHHPRLGGLHATSPWVVDGSVELRATRKAAPTWHEPDSADYFAPIGDLAQFYRRTPESFAWRGPAYSADPAEVANNRRYLETLTEGRRLIGLSLRGGTLKTARTYRAIGLNVVAPLLEREDLVFVVLDYDDVSDVMQAAGELYGPGKLLWFPSITWAWDYHHKAALVAACDAVVTVCQSVAHLSAAMGHPTHVLTPSKPAWRYGVREGSGDPWYWYPGGHARLHRQQGNSWDQAIAEVLEWLK